MKKDIKKLIERVNKRISMDIAYKNYEVQYILSKRGKITDIIYSDEETVIRINPEVLSIHEYKKGYSCLDEMLFSELDNNKKIEYMTDLVHDYLWYVIEMYYPKQIENKKGMLKYLEYCKKHKITSDYLDEVCSSNPSDLLAFYKRLHDYIKVDDLEVYMSRDVFDAASEKSYLAFILGNKLLSDLFQDHNLLSPEGNYSFCMFLAEDFMNSRYYKNTKYSSYEMLEKYVADKIEIITNTYLTYGNIEIKLLV